MDLIRALLYVLLPLAIAGSLFLVGEGAIQTLAANVHFSTWRGAAQTLALGPVASQKAITLLGSSGAGFYAVNSAMPFEDPSGVANFVEVLMILAIPAALTATYGRIVGNRRQGWVLYAVMLVMFLGAAAVAYPAESRPSPAMRAAGVHGLNMEGKEQRLQASDSTLMAVAGTAVGNGSTNAALDSFTGLGGSIPMANMMTGEVIFGSVGSGLFGMLLMVLLAVFVAGLMVGRTPEYLGKRIEAREIKLVTIGAIAVPLIVLFMTAWAISTRYGMRSIFNAGPQGFSETLYAYTSQANNNGSAFAGYVGFSQPHAPGNAGASGVTFADLAGGTAMLVGRFLPMLAALAVAGSLSGKRTIAAGEGTMRTDTAVFAVLLLATISIVALLDVRAVPDARAARAGPDPEALLMLGQLRSSLVAVIVLTVLLGLAYPLAITGLAQVLWPHQANGSRVERARAARRLARSSARTSAGEARYFQSRPSASADRRRRHGSVEPRAQLGRGCRRRSARA